MINTAGLITKHFQTYCSHLTTLRWKFKPIVRPHLTHLNESDGSSLAYFTIYIFAFCENICSCVASVQNIKKKKKTHEFVNRSIYTQTSYKSDTNWYWHSELHQSLLHIPQSPTDVSPCLYHTPLTTKLQHELKNCFCYREVCKVRGRPKTLCVARCFIQAGSKLVVRYDDSCLFTSLCQFVNPEKSMSTRRAFLAAQRTLTGIWIGLKRGT